MADRVDIDEPTGVETTGHEWDGIRELNNPLPRWWLITFYLSVVISVIYWVFMPAWPALPGFQGNTRGLSGNSERINVARDMARLETTRAGFKEALVNSDLTDIEQAPELLQFALAAGQSAFGDNCATCHGSGGQGARGYPNLNDDVWLWGGTLSDIQTTIRHGIRADDDLTRLSEMPAFGRDELLSASEIDDVTEYVLRLSGQEAREEAAGRGGAMFAEQCAACHGETGQGERTFGAPNLTDPDWLYGGERETIGNTITNARSGVMPAWQDRLDPATIAALAVYVHALGGGE